MAHHPAACRCGRVPGPSDNFCPGCGAPMETGLGRDGQEAHDAPDGLLIVGAESGRLESSTVVRSSTVRRRALLGAAFLAVLLVGLTLWPTGERSTPGAAIGGDPTDGASGDEVDGGPVGDEPSGPADRSTGGTEGAAATRDDASSIGISIGSGAGGLQPADGAVGPLLGEATGLGLVFGTPGFGPHDLVELDTGVVHELSATGELLGVMGSTVVVRQSNSLALYPLDTADPVGIAIEEDGSWINVMSITEDRLWTSNGSAPQGSGLSAYDRTGTRVDVVDTQMTFPFFGWDPRAEFIQGLAGGIYRRDGDGFRRALDAALVAAGDDVILVRECDDRLACGLVWYRKNNLTTPLDWWVPDVLSQSRTTVVGGDRWLVVQRWNGATAVHDVRTGRLVWSGDVTNGGPIMFGSPSISADGRWLVEAGFDGIIVVDLDSGAEWPIDAGSEFAVLVDLADVGDVG
ncbi:MAG: hypothetical protein AAGA65_04210 [Actinomycetota bacterium]